MQIHNTTNLPVINNSIITIGSFDGVHKGHCTIFNKLKALAKQQNGESIVITFEPHPRTIIQPNSLLQIITTAEEKIKLFENIGIDHLVIFPFTQEFANESPKHYIEEFIINKFKPKIVVIGYDHHFGKNREGNYLLLEEYAKNKKFELIEIEEHTLNSIQISSTKIRNSLLHGEIEEANNLLGYSYFFTGTIIKGKQLGRTIGFKTANLLLKNSLKLIPGNGVYIVNVQWKNELFKGMMNIGTRPTVDGLNRVIEVHILNFDEEIYGEELTITILKRLRNEQKFDGLESLKNQLEKDKQNAIVYFATN